MTCEERPALVPEWVPGGCRLQTLLDWALRQARDEGRDPNALAGLAHGSALGATQIGLPGIGQGMEVGRQARVQQDGVLRTADDEDGEHQVHPFVPPAHPEDLRSAHLARGIHADVYRIGRFHGSHCRLTNMPPSMSRKAPLT